MQIQKPYAMACMCLKGRASNRATHRQIKTKKSSPASARKACSIFVAHCYRKKEKEILFSFPRVIIKLVCPSRKPLKTTVDKMIHGCKPARPLKQCFFFCSKCKSQADGTKQNGLGEVGASHLLHDATRSRWKKTTLHRHCHLELATSKILKFKR